MGLLVAALTLFVGSHILLSWHPIRAPLVARLGEKGFQGLYSVVALATLVGAVQVYRGLEEVPLWAAGPGLYHPAALVMLFASVLFVGSFTPRNRALAGVPQPPLLAGGPSAPAVPVSGVLGITRHPMMWAFGLWALVHGALAGDPPTLALTAAIAILAFGGAAAQDAKKRRNDPFWPAYEGVTSYWPFGAQISGRLPWRSAWPGWWPLLGGLLFWLALTYVHPWLMQAPVVGFWEWMQ